MKQSLPKVAHILREPDTDKVSSYRKMILMRVVSMGGKINLFFFTVQTINQHFMNIFLEWLFIFSPKINSSFSLVFKKNELLTLNFKPQINLFLLIRISHVSWENERTAHLAPVQPTQHCNNPVRRGAALLAPIWKSSKLPEQPSPMLGSFPYSVSMKSRKGKPLGWQIKYIRCMRFLSIHFFPFHSISIYSFLSIPIYLAQKKYNKSQDNFGNWFTGKKIKEKESLFKVCSGALGSVKHLHQLKSWSQGPEIKSCIGSLLNREPVSLSPFAPPPVCALNLSLSLSNK